VSPGECATFIWDLMHFYRNTLDDSRSLPYLSKLGVFLFSYEELRTAFVPLWVSCERWRRTFLCCWGLEDWLSDGRREHPRGQSGHRTLIPDFEKCFRVPEEAAHHIAWGAGLT